MKITEGYEYYVITFFREVLEDIEKQGQIKAVKFLNYETVEIPIYEMEYMEKRFIYPWDM